MKEFKNVIGPCILKEEPEKLVIQVIPPPELHLYEHIITKVTDTICAVDPSYKDFLNSKNITRHGYNGGGYDGPNYKKIVECMDELEAMADLRTMPMIATLRKFKQGIVLKLI